MNLDQLILLKQRVPWKIVAVVVATVVLVVMIVLGAQWLVSRGSEQAQRSAVIEKASQALDRSLLACDQEKNPEKCRVNLVEETAVKVGAAEICSKLSGEALFGCAWQVAKEKMEVKACDLITDKLKKDKCADSVYRDLASAEKKVSWCEKIVSEIGRSRCVSSLSQEIAKTDGCEGTGVDASVCEQIKALSEAVASGDPNQCATLSPAGSTECLDVVGSVDKDSDGLSRVLEDQLGTSDEKVDSDGDSLTDSDEYNIYKSNPAVADTDGDGYNDSDELESGYNPNGSGKL